MSNPMHSAKSPLWYTPLEILGAARSVLGSIDLDPASDAFGNLTVGAARYINEAEDGLLAPWHSDGSPGSVFVNPPGGVRPLSPGSKKGSSLPLLFWLRLMHEREAGRLAHAVVVSFTLEALSRSQGNGAPGMPDFPLCLPAKRTRYVQPDGTRGKSPAHASAVVYVPGTVDRSDAFAEAFASLGCIVAPYTKAR